MSSKDLLLQLLEQKLLRGGCSCDMMGEGRRRRKRRTKKSGKSAAKVIQGKKLAKYNKLIAAGYPKRDAKKLSGLGVIGGAASADTISGRRGLMNIEARLKNNKDFTPDEDELIYPYLEEFDGVCGVPDKFGNYIYDPVTGECGDYRKIYKKYGRSLDNYEDAFTSYNDKQYDELKLASKKKAIQTKDKIRKAKARAKLIRELGFKPKEMDKKEFFDLLNLKN